MFTAFCLGFAISSVILGWPVWVTTLASTGLILSFLASSDNSRNRR